MTSTRIRPESLNHSQELQTKIMCASLRPLNNPIFVPGLSHLASEMHDRAGPPQHAGSFRLRHVLNTILVWSTDLP
jgi:hypothetical protein